MIAGLARYLTVKDSGVPWVGVVPEHWEMKRAKWLFTKMNRPIRDSDEVVTCFRDGTVTLRKNRRVSGFTESLKEIGYQGIREGDLVIHAMDAFADERVERTRSIRDPIVHDQKHAARSG